jgi:BirA family biotin operon repressor/biotin-[acetyl-CoA-carboxylase] ligase
METSPSYLLNSIMEYFTKYYKQIQEGEYTTIRQLYHQHLYLRGQCCRFQDSEGEFLGKISHVEADGHLIIEDNHLRQRRYAFKEVKFLNINQNINQ